MGLAVLGLGLEGCGLRVSGHVLGILAEPPRKDSQRK